MKPLTVQERESLREQVRNGRIGNDGDPQCALFDLDDIEALLESEACWREKVRNAPRYGHYGGCLWCEDGNSVDSAECAEDCAWVRAQEG